MLGDQRIGDVFLACAAARQRRHEDAVGGGQVAEAEFAEKSGHVSGSEVWLGLRVAHSSRVAGGEILTAVQGDWAIIAR